MLDPKDSETSLKCEVPYAPEVVIPLSIEYKQPNRNELASILSRLRSVCLRNYSDNFENKSVCESSPYTEVSGGSKRLIIKKTSLCWLLRQNEGKLSSDRLKRVHSSAGNHLIYRIQKNRRILKKKTKTKCMHFRDLH